jgi:hypothetical protein
MEEMSVEKDEAEEDWGQREKMDTILKDTGGEWEKR